MAEIVSFPAQGTHSRSLPARRTSPPRLHDDLRSCATLFAAGCSMLLTALCFCLAVLMAGALFYDGAFLGIGPDGLCLGLRSCSAAGYAHMGLFSPAQRAVVAADLASLSVPALMILAQLRGLFRLYAAGIVFAPDNVARISRVGCWLLAYSAAPLLAHWMSDRVAVFAAQSWFHPDEAAAMVIGLSLLLVARVIACGREIEQHRDLFL